MPTLLNSYMSSIWLSGSNPGVGKERSVSVAAPTCPFSFLNVCRIWYRRRTFSFLLYDLQNLYSPVRIWMAPRKPLWINASGAIGGVDFLLFPNLGPLFRFLAFFRWKNVLNGKNNYRLIEISNTIFSIWPFLE